MQIKHILSNSVADGTVTGIVRPSDWNSSHSFVATPGVFPLFRGEEVNKTVAAHSSMMSTIFWQPLADICERMSITRADLLFSMVSNVSSGTANTTYGGTISRGLAFYSFNGTSLALYTSQSGATNFSWTSNDYSNWIGIRHQSVAFNATLNPGQWWLAWSYSSAAVRTNSTGGTAATTIANSYYSGIGPYTAAGSGDWGAASAANTYVYPFFGWYTAQSNAFPASVGYTDLVYTVATQVVGYARGL